MAGVMRYGPTPWWETPGMPGTGQSKLNDLNASAPAGYTYNPVNMAYERTPDAAGTRVYDYNNAASGGALKSLYNQFGGLMGGAGGAGGVGGAGGTGTGSGGGTIAPIAPSSIPNITAPDMTAANNAIFSKAKDRAGSLARASLNSLNGELGAQGMNGSGAAAQGARDIIQGGAGMLEDTNNTIATTNAQQAADFAKLSYQGGITQRGQDIQHEEANAQLQLAAQDRYMKMLQLLFSQFGGGGGASAGGGFNGF